MIREFEIVKVVIHHNRGLVVFAQHLGSDHNFHVPDGSMLEDLPIYYYEIKSLREERPDIFVFSPLNLDRLFDKRFQEGQKVTLTISD